MKAADLSLQEVAYGLRDYLSGLEANPGRLEEVETRLAAIDRMKRKYARPDAQGNRSPKFWLSWKKCAARLPSVEHAGERMEELRREQQRLWPANSKSSPPT